MPAEIWSGDSLVGGRRYWELISDDELVATLTFDRASSSLVTLETADGTWQMRRQHGFSFDVQLYELDSPDPIGIYHPHWTGTDGLLRLRDQYKYTWVATNFWNTHYEVCDHSANTVVLRYTNGLHREWPRDIFKTQATMDILDTNVTAADLALLSGWGFYQAMLVRDQSLLMSRYRVMMFAARGSRRSDTRRAASDTHGRCW